MLDHVRELLDRHYDTVFTDQWIAAHPHDDTPGAEPSQRVAEQPTPDGSTASLGGAVPPRRRNACRVDPRVLEAHTSQRYETFRLPRSVTDMLRAPRDENDWSKAERRSNLIIDLADGCLELHLNAEEVTALRDVIGHRIR